jgi:hypothetical protein
LGIFGEENLWHPELNPGDSLVFLEETLHRTYMIGTMKKERISLEIRVISDNSYLNQASQTHSHIPIFQ